MRTSVRVFLILSAAHIITACGVPPSTSTVSIRYGEEIPETEFPAVVYLGNCTGTFVSDTTLITAKHCVSSPDRNGRVRNPVRLPRLGNIVSTQVYANPRGSQCCTKHDVAVVLFPPGTAPAVAPMLERAPISGDSVSMVGFGGRQGDPTAGPSGVKRMGTNVISAVQDGMILTRMPRGSGLAPGDSGGPLFIDGQFAGVASSGDGRTWSRHVEIADEESRRFFQLAVDGGAVIPGFEPNF